MKLIKLNEKHYIIVDGFEVKKGDYIYESDQNNINIVGHDYSKNNKDFRITYSTKPLEDIIRFNNYIGKGWVNIKQLSLSEVEELLFGYSVEKLAESRWNEATANLKLDTLNKGMWCGGFQHGFNAHKELTKDRFLEKEFIDWIDKEEVLRSGGGWIKYFNGRGNYFNSLTELYDFWKSLQPTEWEVEYINGKLTLKQ